MKTRCTLLLAGLALLAGSAANAASRPAHGRMLGVVPHHGAPAAVSSRRLLSRTLASGTAATCGTSCADYEAAINQYFTDVAHDSGTTSNVYSVATQYLGANGQVPYSSTFAGSTVDTNDYPANGCNDTALNSLTNRLVHDTHCLTDLQLQTEIKKVIAANGWQTGTSNLYFIFLPTDVGVCFRSGSANSTHPCSTNSFCAYHSNTPDNQVIYGVEPDDETIPTGGCDFLIQDPNNPNVDPTLSTVSHEQNEAITDPEGDAWFASDGSEIGDLCAWTFGAALGGDLNAGTAYNQVINGHHYWLQEEYSNAEAATGGCVQQLGGAASAPDPTLHDGSGPLLPNGGPVMQTNTVRAIYWIPPGPSSAPRASAKPRISGKTKVGRVLSASSGSWSDSPTSFRYQWLRCSARGTACKRISHATTSRYKLVKRDAEHKLRVKVTAVNGLGSGASTSAATRLVR